MANEGRFSNQISVNSLRLGWMSEPLTRAGVEFTAIREWLKKNRLFDWDRIDSVAQYVHPDYQFDQKSRQWIPNRPTGAALYWMMEQGQFQLKLIQLAAPGLYKRLPAKFQGIPVEHAINVLITSGLLACHEYERVHAAFKAKPSNDLEVARHLYWFTRFSALWHRTHSAPPRAMGMVNAKRAKAKAWQERLQKCFIEYRARHPKASIRAVVIHFLKLDGSKPQAFQSRYRWGLKNLGK